MRTEPVFTLRGDFREIRFGILEGRKGIKFCSGDWAWLGWRAGLTQVIEVECSEEFFPLRIVALDSKGEVNFIRGIRSVGQPTLEGRDGFQISALADAQDWRAISRVNLEGGGSANGLPRHHQCRCAKGVN